MPERFLAVLRLAFSDITEPIELPGYTLFDDGHAIDIVTFAQQWTGVDRIVIHCQAGLSRSPGIAMALWELLAWGSAADLEQSHPLWNKWVRQELVRVGRTLLQPQE